MSIAWTLDPKKSSLNVHIVTHLYQFMTQNSEIGGEGKKIPTIL